MNSDEFRRSLVAWLDDNDAPLRLTGGQPPSVTPDLDDELAQFRHVKQALFDAGWGRYGWAPEVGGLGGSPMFRAIVGEEIASRDLAEPGLWSMIEVLAPTVIAFGSPELIATMVPPLLRGDETWCQGFSEPSTGSDLASLTCKATKVDGGFRVSGQKVWTSYAQVAQRCILLTRTGEPGSAHRGITALFVDMDSPGLTFRPIEIQSGALEFCEVFYDDVFVPESRLLGSVGQGWQVAMDILPYERSTSFWHRGAFLHHRMDQMVAAAAAHDGQVNDHEAHVLGEAYQAVMAFRCRSLHTQHRVSDGEQLGAETSVDKILTAIAEQTLFDAARDVLPGVLEFGTDADAARWRREFMYSRAATIYGGTSEIQRNIVARRLLNMGVEA